MSMHAEAFPEASDTKIAPNGREQMFTGQGNATFLLDDHVLQLTVLRQLQEYSSQADASILDESERSANSLQTHFPSIPSASGMMSNSHIKEPLPVATYTSHQKRKLADGGDYV